MADGARQSHERSSIQFSPAPPKSPVHDGAHLEIQDQRASHDVSSAGPQSPRSGRNSSIRGPRKQNTFDSTGQKIRRSKTAKVFQPKNKGRSWKPGQEPGIDPHWGNSPHAPVGLKQNCEITAVDFSPEADSMDVQYLDNETLQEFLDTPRPPETCRWISVNGLSWDVISMLGIANKFHRLAVEDMLNRRNRTKADWYSDHTYIVLPLQKLVHTHIDEKCDHMGSEDNLLPSDPSAPGGSRGKDQTSTWRRIFGAGKQKADDSVREKGLYANGTAKTSKLPPEEVSYLPPAMRTLQRYHAGTNEERTEYMEEHSALRPKQLAVSVEQVSIFLTSDNTVVSFFEQSAEDVETPILGRISSVETVLRRTSNASMVVQAIIDAIVDLAIPVSGAYRDAIDELELDVITDPAIKHARSLYIIASETSAFRDTIYPISQLLSALRDHKASKKYGRDGAAIGPENRTVVISPWSYAYFGDVEDHVVLITDNIDQQRRSVENMIDLIFNTIAAYQNESMKQLTVVTIFFLPLSFLTGYFGMNFAYFAGVEFNSDLYFWQIALPLMFVVTVWLMRDWIYWSFVQKKQKYGIKQKRKKRLGREREAEQKNGVEAKEDFQKR